MPNTNPLRRRRRDRRGGPSGFTIVESMIAAVVLAACVVAVGTAINVSYSQSQLAEDEVMAVSLARQMLEEIAAKPFADPNQSSRTVGPETGETSRNLFDNMDDYAGYDDDSTSQLVADGTTRDISKGRSFTREVTAEYRANPQGPADPDGELLFVTVTVTTPDGRVVSLPRLFSALDVDQNE